MKPKTEGWRKYQVCHCCQLKPYIEELGDLWQEKNMMVCLLIFFIQSMNSHWRQSTRHGEKAMSPASKQCVWGNSHIFRQSSMRWVE